ncbi:hypothetical protein [Glutamicibacter sp.]|uniref:hypothetical protein n=1 Tax=Glutamicibacter sp. TaxID=1931995 RepID=UPI002FDF2BD6
MKHQPIQPPLLGVIERLQLDRNAEVSDILQTLGAVGINATKAQGEALYDEGLRGVGCFNRNKDPREIETAIQTMRRLEQRVHNYSRKA